MGRSEQGLKAVADRLGVPHETLLRLHREKNGGAIPLKQELHHRLFLEALDERGGVATTGELYSSYVDKLEATYQDSCAQPYTQRRMVTLLKRLDEVAGQVMSLGNLGRTTFWYRVDDDEMRELRNDPEGSDV